MSDFSPEDPLPALQAAIDQMVANAPLLAGAAWGVFQAFAAEGFTESQAIYLTAVQLKDSPGKAP